MLKEIKKNIRPHKVMWFILQIGVGECYPWFEGSYQKNKVLLKR